MTVTRGPDTEFDLDPGDRQTIRWVSLLILAVCLVVLAIKVIQRWC